MNKTHCSQWSGIPQDVLSENNRKHIELLVFAFGTGPWNIPINWKKMVCTENETVVKIKGVVTRAEFVRLSIICLQKGVVFFVKPCNNRVIEVCFREFTKKDLSYIEQVMEDAKSF